jgi:hypothetical protein
MRWYGMALLAFAAPRGIFPNDPQPPVQAVGLEAVFSGHVAEGCICSVGPGQQLVEAAVRMSVDDAADESGTVRPHVRDRDGGSPRIMWERGLRWIGRRRASHIGDEPWDRIARCMLVWIPRS